MAGGNLLERFAAGGERGGEGGGEEDGQETGAGGRASARRASNRGVGRAIASLRPRSGYSRRKSQAVMSEGSKARTGIVAPTATVIAAAFGADTSPAYRTRA